MQHIQNSSIGEDVEFEVDGYKLIEMIRQQYGGNNCTFSAGIIENHPIEHVYLKWQKDGDEGSMLWLTSDEMAAIAWICSGTLWSLLIKHNEKPNETTR